MLTKEQAIVLRAADYKEKDKQITLFTLENGLIKAILKGVKSEKAKLKFAAMPFCFAEYELQDGVAMPIVSGANLIESFYSLTQNIGAYYAGFAVLKAIENVSNFGEQGQALFILTLKTLKALTNFVDSNLEDNVLRLIKLKFVLSLSKLIGFEIDFSKCGDCGKLTHDEIYYDIGAGHAVCARCQNPTLLPISTKLAALILLIQKTEFHVIPQIKCADYELLSMERVINAAFESKTSYHFE